MNSNNTVQRNQQSSEIVPTGAKSTKLHFNPLEMLKRPGKPRKMVLIWLMLCVFIIPSSVITRYLEWTGIELTLGGLTFFVTIYIPMLICIPIVFWFGYLWAAIPAYISTFLVAYVGGMPLEWIVIFSFANPLSLAFYSLSIQVIRLRPNLLDPVSLIGFVLISLVASLAGSTGSFIWAYANQVGLNEAQLVWQGWWVGGWLQAVFLALPILHFAGPKIERWIAPLSAQNTTQYIVSYKILTVATTSFMLVLVGYVLAARFISIKQLTNIQNELSDNANLMNIQNAIDGMSYPLYILLAVMLALTYLIYRVVIFWHHALSEANSQLSDQNLALEKLATTDPLTELLNRRKIMELADLEFQRAKRKQHSLSILMVDIDRFKRINDKHGHLVGDNVIKVTAERIMESLRPYDSSGRYGGEEFIVLLPETQLHEALEIAKRVLSNVTKTRIQTSKDELAVTVSIGVASLNSQDDLSTTIERADQALFQAKQNGRNQVNVSP